MRKLPVAYLAALAFLLAACTGGAMQTGIDLSQDAGAGIVRNISAADLASLKATCAITAPAVNTVVADPGAPAPVKDIAVYPAAFCKQILTGDMGNVNSNSLKWLPVVLSDVRVAATIAGYVLPLLPLL